MKNYILGFLILVLAIEIIYLFLIDKSESKPKVLAEATILAIDLTPSPSASPSPSPTVSPKPTPRETPSPSPVPQPTFSSSEIYEFTNRFAGQYGVDPNVIRAIAICESGFKPNAKYIKYVGLFQFDSVTWKNLRIKMGEDHNPDLRANAEEAVQTAAYAISIGKRGIWPNCNP